MQWWCAATGAAWTWSWTAYPGVWLFVAALAGLYALIVRRTGPAAPPTARRGTDHPGWRKASFASGLLLLWVALDWPVGPLGAGYLASVHMVQFLLIALAAPPLLLLGVPEAAWRRLAGRPRAAAPLRFVTHPLVSLALFVILMTATHWPPVVDGLMPTQLGAFVLDVVWLASGTLFWWPVVAPVPERPWFGHPLKMGHLLAATLLNTGVFAYLTFSDLPLYRVYELAPPTGFLSAREDQRLAGLLMKIGGAPILWTGITVLFFRWHAASERDEAVEEAR